MSRESDMSPSTDYYQQMERFHGGNTLIVSSPVIGDIASLCIVLAGRVLARDEALTQ